jgi:hypothetical protein
VVRDPRLRGNCLDDVVTVGRLQWFEEIEGAAGTTGAAHVHADRRVAHVLRDERARLRRVRIGGRVAGVLDHGRVRALVGRTRQLHCDRELHAVAHCHVAVAVADRLLCVRARVGRSVPLRSPRPARSPSRGRRIATR